ncbi:MAG: SMC-Scp complex subunit ScpB [Candidatus Zambryskibacteria bacterium]|nr:SMC-Scp complex subunit ScpB [Candidatus Zambryskibacteria bacterium]
MLEQNIKNNSNLSVRVEAILFYLAEPVEIKFLVKTLEVPREDIVDAINEIEASLSNRGIKIVRHNDEVSLVTSPELGGLIEKIIKEERERDLGRAGIETLAIVAYKGPVSKKEIEYIRGVNSQYALRNLLLRGLVEKKGSETLERVIVYSITTETLRFLGLGNISDLPEYKEVQKQLEVIEETEEEKDVIEDTRDANGD